MKHGRLSLALALALAAAAWPAAGASPAASGTIEFVIPIEQPVMRAADDGQTVELDGYGSRLEPGQPRLPARVFAVAIPPGAEPVSVEVDGGELRALSGRHDVSPARPPRVIGDENPELAARDQAIYESNYRAVYQSDEVFPAEAGRSLRRAAYRGYNLVDVLVTPVRYQPLSGRLLASDRVTIRIAYRGATGAPVPAERSPEIERTAREIVANYDQAQAWLSPPARSRDLHQLVIVTTEAIAPALTALVNWETQKGNNPEVVTVEWIGASYTGVDLAQKVRNFLREKYPAGQWGIEHVLLAGHPNQVPMRTAWQDAGYGRPLTDFYYAELSLPDSSSWDADGDGRYGEDNDPCDFYAEVNVGRIPWSDVSTVQSIAAKSVAYEQNDDPGFKESILLLGSFFWDDTDNAVLMEAKIDQPWMADWNVLRMYEKNSGAYSSYDCDFPLLRANVQAQWSAGSYAFVNWAGHGSPTSAHIMGLGSPSFIQNSDCNLLNDDYPAIIFADACSNSDMDETNIGMAMLQRGGVGFVGATKVAYACPGWSDPSDGSTQSLDYYFTTSVTSTEYTQGAAHQHAMRTLYTQNLWGDARYETFEWNIWGVPTLGMGEVISGDGQIALDRALYRPDSTILVSVIDPDLNTGAGQTETCSVTLTTTGGDSETVVLTETGTDSSEFAGQIGLTLGAPTPGNGVLGVAHGHDVIATYIDADDGQGGTNVFKTATCRIDGEPPVISAVAVESATDVSAVIVWTTDEPSDSIVRYGEDLPLAAEVADSTRATSHRIELTGLTPCVNYLFEVGSCDEAGNEAADNAGGSYYTAQTMERVEVLIEPFNSDPGWTISGGEWAFGQPTGGSGDHGAPDPTSGHTGSYVYGYNLQGGYTNFMPEYSLTTPALDCSEGTGTKVEFWAWLGVERNQYDHARFQISTNGSSFSTIWENTTTTLDGGAWQLWSFDISSWADGQDSVYLRWTMGDTDQGWTYCGWNIDDLAVTALAACDQPTPTPRPTHTPTPDTSPTPAPTATPTPPVIPIGIELTLNQSLFHAGDPFRLAVAIWNHGAEEQAGLAVVLAAAGEYWFYPSWSQDPDWLDTFLGAGTSIEDQEILAFTWPEGEHGSASGIQFIGALISEDAIRLLCDPSVIEFGFE